MDMDDGIAGEGTGAMGDIADEGSGGGFADTKTVDDKGAVGVSGIGAVTTEMENGGGSAPDGAEGAGRAVTVTSDTDWPSTTVTSTVHRTAKNALILLIATVFV
jgi:hypothetical protein